MGDRKQNEFRFFISISQECGVKPITMPAVSSQQPHLVPKMKNSSVTTVVDFYSIVPFLQPFSKHFSCLKCRTSTSSLRIESVGYQLSISNHMKHNIYFLLHKCIMA